MRFSLAVAVALVGISISGWAQQNKTYHKVKPSAHEKAPNKVPIKAVTPATGSGSASKDLQNLEHQTARTTAPRTARSNTSASTLKPVKNKPTPPINFGGTSNGKSVGKAQSTNPYKGRLRQKHGGHQ
jgi:hypothetical protein